MTQFIDLVTIQKGFFLSNLVLFVTLGNEISDMKIEIQDIPQDLWHETLMALV
jgi:hypothetical protein